MPIHVRRFRFRVNQTRHQLLVLLRVRVPPLGSSSREESDPGPWALIVRTQGLAPLAPCTPPSSVSHSASRMMGCVMSYLLLATYPLHMYTRSSVRTPISIAIGSTHTRYSVTLHHESFNSDSTATHAVPTSSATRHLSAHARARILRRGSCLQLPYRSSPAPGVHSPPWLELGHPRRRPRDEDGNGA